MLLRFLAIFILSLIVVHSVSAQPPREEAYERLSKAIQFETVSSYDTSQVHYNLFEQFIQFLEKEFPLVHQHLEKILINRYSIIYHWKGSEENLKPFLLAMLNNHVIKIG